MRWRSWWQRLDWWLIAAIALLSLVSLVTLFSLNEASGALSVGRFQKQAGFVAGAFVLIALFSQLSYRRWLQYGYACYGIAVVLLVGVLLFGTNIRGTTGWFQFAGISLQPVEFAKILFLIALTRFLSDRGMSMQRWRTLGWFLAILQAYS